MILDRNAGRARFVEHERHVMKDFQAETPIDRARADYRAHRLTRRAFVSTMVGTGLGLSGANAIADSTQTTPRRGGHVRVASYPQKTSTSLDPAKLRSTIDITRANLHLNGLFAFNEKLEPVPELVESWETAPDGTRYTFHLRQGVTWHDGKEFTAADVAHSMNRLIGHNSRLLRNDRSLIPLSEQWNAEGRYTVHANLKGANWDLPASIAMPQFKIIQDNAEEIPGYFNKPIGTGPFQLTSKLQNNRSTLSVRNANYWKENQPYIDSIETLMLPQAKRLHALDTGFVHIAAFIHPRAIEELQRNGKGQTIQSFITPSGTYGQLIVRMNQLPEDFALALKYLCPRTQIAKELDSLVTVANDHPITPLFNIPCNDIEQREHDPERAKFHLRRSGITSVTVQTASLSGNFRTVLKHMHIQARQAGLRLTYNHTYDKQKYFREQWKKSPMFMTVEPMWPTPRLTLASRHYSVGWKNNSLYSNKQLDRLIIESWYQKNPLLRAELTCQAISHIKDHSGVVIPCFDHYYDGMDNRIRGVPRIPFGSFAQGQFADSIHFA